MTSESKGAPRRKGCLRPACLVRAPLGCLAFLLGASVVLGFLLPAALGSVIEPAWEQGFAQAHQGTLSFGEFRLAWFSPQRIENIMLRDPNGGYVASGELRLPPLGDCFRRLDTGVLSPIEVDFDANLQLGDDGSFNLARALAVREDAPPPREEGMVKIGSGDGDGMFEGVGFGFELGTGRLACTTPRLRSAHRELVLVFDEGQALFSDPGPHSLSAKGRVDGGGSLELACAFDDAAGLLAGVAPATWSVKALDVSTQLLGALLPFDAPCQAALGERVSLRFAKPDAAAPRAELELRGDPARIDVAAVLEAGALVSGPDAPASARADFTLGGYWRDEVVLRLLPVLSALEPSAADGVARLELTELSLPRGGGLQDLYGDLRLELPELSLTLLARRSPGSDPAPGPGLSDGPLHLAPLHLRLEGGVIHYPNVTLDLSTGRAILAGQADLARDELALTLTLDPALARTLGLPAEDDQPVALSIHGPAAEPLVRRLNPR